MPHITLLYPFEEQAAFGLALPQLQEVCDTIDTFTISFLSFDVFRDGSPFTLYLKPQTSVNISLQVRHLHRTNRWRASSKSFKTNCRNNFLLASHIILPYDALCPISL